ncbi:MAG TPA: UrcA family protein [Vitreimonas sp.]|uniref:UrcA family protein n=1 Tax=Vitreimonas sp. TaxID=3069702 RepID=UPI002D287D9F|nr:UrcA family protein [Vitreimonas sp.]HYD87243.1 UrcA family protein [Vitreimonas sp.]
MKFQLTSIVLAVALSAAVAAPAYADNGRYATRVAYADLDLDRAAGADAVINRLENAAAETCGDRMGQMNLREHRRIRACATQFTQKGVMRIGNPLVAQRYLDRGGRLPNVIVTPT